MELLIAARPAHIPAIVVYSASAVAVAAAASIADGIRRP